MFCNNSNAQKSKSKKDKSKDSTVQPSVTEKIDEIKVVDISDMYETKGEGLVAPQMVVEEPGDSYTRKTGKPTTTKTLINSSGKYYLITTSTNSSYSYKFGIEDTAGNTILPTIFSSIKNVDDGYIIRLGNYYSLLDTAFKTILPMEFENIELIGNKKWYIVKRRTGGTQVINKNGIEQIAGNFKNIKPLFLQRKASSNYLVFENKEGKQAIYNLEKSKFEMGFVAKNILPTESAIIIVEDTCTRIVDNTFKPITNETFTSVFASRNNAVIVVNKKNKKGLLSFTGKYVLPCEYDVVDNINTGSMDLFIVAKNGKYSCVDYLGKNILNDTYDLVKPMSSSYAASGFIVKSNKKVGIKDFLNHTVVPIEFDTIYNNYGYYYIAQKQNKIVRYTLSGNVVNEIVADKIETLTYDNKSYSINNKVGLMNTEFETLTKPEFDKIDNLGGVTYDYYSRSKIQGFRVTLNNKMGIITKKGELVLPIKYDLIEDVDGYVMLVKQNDKYGLIRESDYKIIAECDYDLIGTTSNSYGSSKYVATKNGVVSYFNN